METRQGMNENRLCLKALFYPCRGEPMPAAVAVVARWSPPPPLVTCFRWPPPVKRGQATLSSTTHLYHTQSYQTQRNIHQEWKDRPASMHVCHLLLTLLISIIKCLQHASIKNFCHSSHQTLSFSQANPLSCSATITIHQVHFRIFNAQ